MVPLLSSQGFAAAGCDSVPRIRAYLAAVSRHLDRGEDFRSLYQWLFGFAKENSQRKVLCTSHIMHFISLPRSIVCKSTAFTYMANVFISFHSFF